MMRPTIAHGASSLGSVLKEKPATSMKVDSFRWAPIAAARRRSIAPANGNGTSDLKKTEEVGEPVAGD